MGGTKRWAELRMCRFWAGGISSFPFSRAREYRLLRRLLGSLFEIDLWASLGFCMHVFSSKNFIFSCLSSPTISPAMQIFSCSLTVKTINF
jgi:hypothetical protein